MITLYGSPMCIDCRNCKRNFDKFGIEYEYVDINENLKNLKKFLTYRDNYPSIFDRLKKIHDIGIPCLVEGDNVFTDWETYLINKGYTELEYEDYPSSCSLDGKGC